ncbi:MAG: D-alanine--D-alanine ligase [Candidatus Omnitrophica bacterium]|nr:D-alanine--D-alanine ligase [Candidatus Omnitrophota bacterium]
MFKSNNDKKTGYGKIAVLAGGPSSEREISIKSGRAVYEALKRKNLDVFFLDAGTDAREKLKNAGFDIIFIALHGRFGEDGTIQAMIEELGIPYTGSGVHASRLAMNKVASREVFSASGMKVPRYQVANKGKDLRGIPRGFKTPFVVKPQSEGSSIGLTIVRDKADFEKALKKAFVYHENALVEEYIHGRELTVGILENKALPVIEIVTKNQVYDYEAKYENETTKYIVPANLSENDKKAAETAALKAHSLLGCRDFSRVDMRMDDKGDVFVLEVNTIPGMTSVSLLPKAARAANISFEDLCMRLIELAHKRGEARNGEKQVEQKEQLQ